MRKKLAFIGGGVNSNVGKVHFSASQMDGLWSVDSGIFSKNINDSIKTAKLWNIDKNRVYNNFNQFVKVEKNLTSTPCSSIAVMNPVAGAPISCAIRSILSAGRFWAWAIMPAMLPPNAVSEKAR